jgi:hypothetical protein
VGNEVLSWEPGEIKPRARWSDALTGKLTGLEGIYDVAAGREWVAAGGRNGLVYFLRAAGAVPAGSASLQAGAVGSVALDAAETFAAAGTDKGELRLLRVPSGEVAAGVRAHRDPITALSFGGGLLASGSRDRTVRLWRCEGGRLDPLLDLRLPGPVRSLAFHPDAVRLFVLLEREPAVRVFHLDRLRARLESLGLGAGLEGIAAASLPDAVTESPPVPVVEDARVPGGLRAELFADLNFRHCVKVRFDDRLDFDWGEGSPDPLLPGDFFAVRWTGRLKAPRPGRYTLELDSDDAARVWLDGNLCLDRWSIYSPSSPTAVEVELTDRPHALKVEYFELAGKAKLRLCWSPKKDLPPQPVPASALLHDQPADGVQAGK